jgi:pimeloyl-ACP methyl ester carboxylesterase
MRTRVTGALASQLALAVTTAVVLAALTGAASASARTIGNVSVTRTVMAAPVAPGTPMSFSVPGIGKPVELNTVAVLKIAPAAMSQRKKAKNVLVLEPGTSAAAAYFVPFAKSLVEAVPGWQVWAVERRENFLENQKEAYRYKRHDVSSEEFFNYYLGWLAGAQLKKHYEFLPESTVEFAKEWGMNVAVEDLKVVIEAAKAKGGKVVLGGHSLGGSVVTAYATWDFGGTPGAQGLSGLVYDDGGSSPLAISKEEAEAALAKLKNTCTAEQRKEGCKEESPWLAFGGIVAPDLGLFSLTGSALTAVEPKGPSLLEKFKYLPPELKGPISPVTNEAGFGYSVNVGTSPESLAAAQIHGGAGVEEEPEMDGLHGWNGSGALTPVPRYAEMLAGLVSGTALPESGSEWYFPARLTLDTGAVGNGLANPAQEVLNLHSTEGENLPKTLHIIAIDSELDKLFGGEQTTLTEAKLLAEQSDISTEECSPSTTAAEGCLTLIEEKNTYAHNDPAGATPSINEFFKHMVPFLEDIAG